MNRLPRDKEEELIGKMCRDSPYAHFQGICFEAVEGDELTLRLPYREELIGNPDTGDIHSGAITVLLDHTLGLAIIPSDLVEPYMTPTLDLRIDHLGCASAGQDIFACARVYRATRRIVFAEGYAFTEYRDKPVARAMASLVLMPEMKLRDLSLDELETA